MRNTCACVVLLASIGWCQRPETIEQTLARMNWENAGQRDVFVVVPPGDPFDLNVPQSQRDRPSGEAISVARLRHKTPKAAERAYGRAAKFVKAEDHQKAAAELEKTVALDPGFADAFDQLGIEYARLDHLPEARVALQRAVELDPDFWRHWFNLGLISYQLGDYAKAQSSAYKAVRLGGAVANTHWLLGFLLYVRQETRTEGIVHLQYAARTMPEAREFLQTMEK
jgi:tetratricopeptide (TPR) repeat protein